MSPQPASELALLTGPSGAGKTRLCQRLAERATRLGWRVTGVLSPAVFTGGVKTGIDVVLLPSGERRHLALRIDEPAPGELGYRFNQDSLELANAHLASTATSDLLIVDELGPLEILHGRGLAATLPLLQRRAYRLCVVVVRPELVDRFATTFMRPNRIIEASSVLPERESLLLGHLEPGEGIP